MIGAGEDAEEFDAYAVDKIQLLMQLRRTGIADTNLLNALETVPREVFLDAQWHAQAYADTALPMGDDQQINAPSVVAWMAWALALEPRHRVLEIGTGSGYQAAVLSKLCRRVYSMEIERELMQAATARLRTLCIENVTTMQGDGSLGWPDAAPFDRVVLTGAVPQVPALLLDQLAEGGILVAPVGDAHGQQLLLRIEKTAAGLQPQHLMPVQCQPLRGDWGEDVVDAALRSIAQG